MSRVIVFGNASLDIILGLAAFPKPGETVLARDVMTCAGGKGLNQAIAAARTGAQVRLVAALGNDPAAAEIASALASETGLASTLLRRNMASDLSTIWLDGSGENVIASSNFCAHSVSPADCDAELAELAPGDWLVLQGNLTRETTERAMGAAKRSKAFVLLNTAPMQDWMRRLLSQVDVLVANEVEALQLAGPSDDVGARLLELGAARVIVTLGPRGAGVVSCDGAMERPAPKVIAIDTAGAGDMFVGTLAACLAMDRPVAFALELAVAAASVSVTRRGTTTSFPTRSELEALAFDIYLEPPLTG